MILVITAVLAVFLLFFFGRTVPPPHTEGDGHDHGAPAAGQQQALDFPTMLGLAKKRLTPDQLTKVTNWEQTVVRGNVKEQQITVYRQLARFWMDSIGAFVPYAKYLGEAAKLENSEKNLTFAAHLLLAEAQTVTEAPLQTWMAVEAKELFEKALALNPANDSTKVGLGGCFFFGGGGSEPPMKGIGYIREVAEKDSTFVYAQYMLGVGAGISRQWPKAIERWERVVALQPDNLEALLRLADALEQNGDKAAAKMQYQQFLLLVKRLEQTGKFRSNPQMLQQIEAHIKTL
ncbi:MAG TPA: tetratricopeptide repeat protein [Lacibacter sp.]|nr:tetratricopeptide repeat protein [Lacibacter sp.]HMO88118.1 tetratricopeptide repeat protein [Lacibacter sp.]HMP86338.1 tetratricopeptide repeat protein [Lacibacter sp.]